jgi:hypothetical protein
MLCPLCGQRKARRFCPALGKEICAVCCGTKRLAEINCPADCGYLVSARSHPPAVQQRQHDRDVRFVGEILRSLSEAEYRLFLILLSAIRRQKPSIDVALRDVDIAEAASALAATYETSARGIIYEHRAASLPAQQLGAALKGVLTELSNQARTAVERDAARALRAIERLARTASQALGDSPAAAIQLLERMFKDAPEATDQPSLVHLVGEEPRRPAAGQADGPRLIVP